ncbi:MAG: fasciclin domain-containing protein [Novosphingobium sp.]
MSKLKLSYALSIALTAAMIPASAALAGHHAQKPTVVSAAVNSPDHTTLVSAVTAAGLAETLSGNGPFTVFAPTNAAFAKLPAGTVETLLQPANRDQLRSVLTYHVVPGKYDANSILRMIRNEGGKATLRTVQGEELAFALVDGKVAVTDKRGGTATVTATDLRQSNGIIHVTDAVSLPG